jgi:hypothetical protein
VDSTRFKVGIFVVLKRRKFGWTRFGSHLPPDSPSEPTGGLSERLSIGLGPDKVGLRRHKRVYFILVRNEMLLVQGKGRSAVAGSRFDSLPAALMAPV